MNRSSSPAFTLVEVLVVAPLIILFIGAFIGMVVTLTGDSLKLRESNAAAYGVQDALDEMGTASGNALGFLTTTGTLVSPQGSGNNTAAFTNGTNTLILSSAATTKNPFDPTRQLVYQGSGTCSSTNPVYSYVTVYFVSGGSLYKRTILPSSPAACTTPWQKPSCAESQVAANPTVCRASDEKLLDNVAGMTITYYDSPSSSTSIPASEAEDAVSVSIQLQASKQVAGDTVSYSGTSRVKRGEGAKTYPSMKRYVSQVNTFACALSGGSLYCWGGNRDGQRATGTTNDYSSGTVPAPNLIGGALAGKTVTDFSVAESEYQSAHVCAVANGQLYCWGDNSHAQLGDGTFTDRYTPTLVGGALAGKTVTKVVTNGDAGPNASSTCAIANGNLYCWGNNSVGQLGINSNTRDSPENVDRCGACMDVTIETPTAVEAPLSGRTITDVWMSTDAGRGGYWSSSYTCATTDTKQLYCWGLDSYNQLGDDTAKLHRAAHSSASCRWIEWADG